MAKTPDQRLRATLIAMYAVNPDAANFCSYCLEEATKAKAFNNYYDSRNDKSAESTNIVKSLSLKSPAWGDQKYRSLRRAAMLLDYLVNGMAFTLTDRMVKTRWQKADEINADLITLWKHCILNEILLYIVRISNHGYSNAIKAALQDLGDTERDKVIEVLSQDLFDGNTAKDKFKAVARGAILLLSRVKIGKLAPIGGTDKYLATKKKEWNSKSANELAVKARNSILSFGDKLPQNTEMQQFLLTFQQDPLKFLQSHSIHPQSGKMPPASDWTVTEVDGKSNGALTCRMGFVPNTQSEKGAFDLTEIDSNKRGMDMYFLPWASRRIIKMTLEKNKGPGVFFTAAINGCSVFVTGTEESPTVYHAGIDGSLKDNYQNSSTVDLWKAAQADNAPRFWRLLLLNQEKLADKDILGEVSKLHYIKDFLTQSKLEDGSPTTPNAEAYEGTIKKQNAITVTLCTAWGCVFGLRDKNDGKWSFFLQENVTVHYADNKTKQRYACSRPIYISRIFPSKKAIDKKNDYANVPNNFEKEWAGTSDEIQNPFDTSKKTVYKF